MFFRRTPVRFRFRGRAAGSRCPLDGSATLVNEGYYGMNFVRGESYTLRLAARATDGFAFRVGAGGLRARILDPELLLNHVAAGKREYQHGGAHAMTQRVHSLGWHGNPWQ